MPTRRTVLTATLNGSPLNEITSASCTYGWRRSVPEATVFVRSNPSPGVQIYNQVLQLTMGAGAHNVLRAGGMLFRRYDYRLWPKALGLVFYGRLIRAAEFQNGSDPLNVGGLTLLDLMGAPTATDADVVRAVLSAAGVSFTGTDIDGTGMIFGSRGPLNFVWRAGTSSNPLAPMRAAGQTALSYTQEWDKASAVYTDGVSPVGFYRTYETVNGVFRALIGGRPRSTPVLTFSEGIDLDAQSSSTRDYPIANSVFVTGWDSGLPNQGPERFFIESSNPLQDQTIISDYSSPYIEWSSEADAGIGMNAERVGNALLADLNRETVTVRFRTARDELILPGYTIQVQGPGGAPDLLGVGEPLWVDEVTTGVAEDGEFYQEGTATGGGTDDHTGAPPG